MDKHDHQFFPMDARKVVWIDYMHKYIKGLRVYLAKEDINNLNVAKRKAVTLKRLHYLYHIFLFIISVLMLLFMFYVIY